MTTDYILNSRYLRNNEKTFNDVAERVGNYIGDTPEEKQLFKEIMTQKKFVPGGRTIACAGTDKVLIPNCVVLPVEDDLAGIFNTLKRAAILQQAGCVGDGTLLLTDLGFVEINKYVNTILNVWNGKQFTPAQIKYTGEKELYNVVLNNGLELRCTEDHPFIIKGTTKKDNIVKPINDPFEKLENKPYEYPTVSDDEYDNEEITNSQFNRQINNSLTPSELREELNSFNKCIKQRKLSSFIPPTETINITSKVISKQDINIDMIRNIRLLSELSVGDELEYCDFPEIYGDNTLNYAFSLGYRRRAQGAETIRVPVKYCELLDAIGYIFHDDGYVTVKFDKEFDMNFIPSSDYTKESRMEWLRGYLDCDPIEAINKHLIVTDDIDFLKRLQLELLTMNIKTMFSYARGSGALSFISPPTIRISSITNISEVSQVFDVTTIDNSHTVIYNGILTHNCGLGFNFSKLRPAKFECKRTGGAASGPISFLNLYAHAFKIVQQYNRSGANMGVLSIDHPDVISFIHIKDDLEKLTNFNISVLITERFMKQYLEDPNSEWLCMFNNQLIKPRWITYTPELIVEDVTEMTITCKDLFDELVTSAWQTGEPGVLFEGNINNNNLLKDILGSINCVNPCGEIPLYDNECCNLGSINLEEFVVNNYVDFNELARVSSIATTFMNNVIDKLHIPDKELSDNVLLLRRLGLGIMGLHDMLIKLQIPYSSEEARDLISRVMDCINTSANKQSEVLTTKYGSVTQRLAAAGYNIPSNPSNHKLSTRANCACTCIAPTGSTSIIHTVSSGIEPYFSLAYKRTIKGELQDEVFVNKHLKQYLIQQNMYNNDTLNKIITQGIDSLDIPEHIKKVFQTAQQITPTDHILMQATAQKHIDNSISKTINLDNSATVDDIRNVLLLAYKQGCKGCTVYRDGCRDSQVFINLKQDEPVNGVKMCKSGSCDI